MASIGSKKYELIEGVDYDPVGEELYKDDNIRIVASGGIPIYTGVGYSTDIGFGITVDAICGPGKGLKTYDYMFNEKYNTIKNSINAKTLKRFSKKSIAFTEDNVEVFPKIAERIFAKAANTGFTPFARMGGVDINECEYTNYLPESNRFKERVKLQVSEYRRGRFLLDPTYGAHVYFRAPSAWPHVVEGGVIKLRENLKGCDIQDFHLGNSYYDLLVAPEDTTAVSTGVIIRIDPSQTRLSSSEARVHFQKDFTDKLKITVSEYLARLRDHGVGFPTFPMEVIATPPSGFLPSDWFAGCIRAVDKEKGIYDIVHPRTGEVLLTDFKEEKKGVQMFPAFLKHMKQRAGDIDKIRSGVSSKEALRNILDIFDAIKNLRRFKEIIPYAPPKFTKAIGFISDYFSKLYELIKDKEHLFTQYRIAIWTLPSESNIAEINNLLSYYKSEELRTVKLLTEITDLYELIKDEDDFDYTINNIYTEIKAINEGKVLFFTDFLPKITPPSPFDPTGVVMEVSVNTNTNINRKNIRKLNSVVLAPVAVSNTNINRNIRKPNSVVLAPVAVSNTNINRNIRKPNSVVLAPVAVSNTNINRKNTRKANTLMKAAPSNTTRKNSRKANTAAGGAGAKDPTLTREQITAEIATLSAGRASRATAAKIASLQAMLNAMA